MHSATSIEIDRPIAEVFEYTNHHVAEWSITVVEDEIIEEKPGNVGSTFRVVTEERGRRMEFQGETVAWREPIHSAVVLRGTHFDIDVAYDFEDLGGNRTRVSQNSVVHGKGLVKVMFLLFGWLMRKSGCEAQLQELRSLKQKLETRARTAGSTGSARTDSA